MINIIEDKCSKLSGITSLFVSFKFNAEIIKVIKTYDKYVYDKKTYTWELPINSLSYLLDNLTYIDDITLKLYKEESNKVHFIPKLEYKTKPFQHQLDAIEYFLNVDKGLLLDQPGLGKSKTIINLAEELQAQKGLQHCLIICGINTLKTNWRKEIKTHSNLTCRIIGEKVTKRGKVHYASVKERAKELREPLDAFFYIINVEMLRSDEIIEALLKSKNKIDMVVVDEIHKCFVGSTLITTNKGKQSIKELVKNPNEYLVKTLNNNKEEFKPIINTYINSTNELLELEIQDEEGKIHTLICTNNHPIYTKNRGYVSANDLNEQDILEIDR